MKRRSFLAGLVAGAVAAPAIVRAPSLMKLWVPPDQAMTVGWDMAGMDTDFSGFYNPAAIIPGNLDELHPWKIWTVKPDAWPEVWKCVIPKPNEVLRRGEIGQFDCEFKLIRG